MATLTLQEIFKLPYSIDFFYEVLTLDSNGKYVFLKYIEEMENASITMDFDRSIVGDARFVFKNDNELNYYSDVIRPWFKIKYFDYEYEFPLGTYLLSTNPQENDGKLVNRNITGYDFLKALDDDTLESSVTYEAGEVVYDIIIDILDNVAPWVKYNIQETDAVLTEDKSYAFSTSKLFIINSLLSMINYYPLWCTGMGVYKSTEWTSNQNIIYTFENNEESIYKSGINLIKDHSQLYNRVIVIGNLLVEETEPLYKIWTMEDEGIETHPLSYTNINRNITKRFYSDSPTQSIIDSKASKLIRDMLEIDEIIQFNHAFVTNENSSDGLPNRGDHYRFVNTLLDVDAIYKIQRFTWNLNIESDINSSIRRVTT